MKNKTEPKPNSIPAFARASSEFAFSQTGMDLRDYFAARAMQAYVSNDHFTLFQNEEKVANWSYKMADLMIKTRKL